MTTTETEDNLAETSENSNLTGIEPDSAEITIPIDLAPLAKQMEHAEKNAQNGYLIVLDGMDVGRQIPLWDDSVVLGKSPKCDITLADDGLSRVHAKLSPMDGGQLGISDLDSTNGTFVGGRRIQKAVIKPGGKILFGRRTLIQYVEWDALDQIYQQRIFDSCRNDGLTGVYNAKYMKNRISETLAYARRHRVPITFLVIDIDKFSIINKNHGPFTGDQVIVFISRTVSKAIRQEDIFCRLSGDEFAILSIETGGVGGTKLAQRIHAILTKNAIPTVGSERKMIDISISIGGITLLNGTTICMEEMLTFAKTNLLKAKQAGGNQIVISSLQ